MTPVLFHFISPTGEPITDTPFDIQLERSDQDEAESGVVLPRLISARTDMEGKAIVSLAPTNQRYHVTLMDKDGGAALHHDFYVPVLNNSQTVVALEDLIVARDAKLSTVAYDEQALLNILNAKAQAMASADAAADSAEAAQGYAEFADDQIQLTVDARNLAQIAATTAVAARDVVLGRVQGAHDDALLAEDRAAAALVSKNAAAVSATAAASSQASAAVQAGLANQSAVDAQGSEDTAIAARDAAAASASLAVSAKTLSEGARDVTVAARDITLAARDVTNAARDTAVAKAAQLTSQLAAFNEIYIGKFAVAPTVDGNGNTLKVGAIYENTVQGKIYQWEADLAWHAYDEESQLQLNNAILSANNAAASAASALTQAQNAAGSSTAAANSAVNAAGSVAAAAVSADAALTAKNAAATSAGEALASKNAAAGSATTATTKAGEAATSAQAAADYLAQAQAGQVQADWTEGNSVNKGFIKNKPVLAPVATSGAKADVGLGNVTNTSDANKPVSIAAQAALDLKENAANKDASNGYAGLSGFKIALKNAAGNVVSYLTSVASIARNWTLPDKDGVIALVSDITGTNSGVNTGDETAASIRTKLGATVVTGSNTGDETNATILSKLGIPSISGTNTGDETAAGIRTKLGIATLSGANTGDQTAASLGLGNVNNTSDLAKPVSTAMQTALDLKANITYVDAKVAALVASSPAALDTLAELATALGNDGNFATTMTNSLASKLPLAGGTLTGSLNTRVPVSVAAITSLNGANAPIYVSQAIVPVGAASYTEMMHNATVLNATGYVQHVSIGAYRPGIVGWGGAVYMAIGGSDNNATEAYYFNYGGTISHSGGGVNITGNAVYATNATRLYASDSGYVYGGAVPYYMSMVYSSTVNRWRLSVTPATPSAIEVAYADTAGLVSGLTIGSASNATTSGGNNMTQNTIGYVTGISVLGQTDGALYGQGYDSTTYQHQIYGDYRTGQIAVRGRGQGNGVWTAWRTVWDSSNLLPVVAATAGTVALRDGGGSIYATTFQGTASKADRVMSTAGGAGTRFNWQGLGGTPQWVWGHAAGDPDNAYVYNPANFSVDNSAKLGGVAWNATMQKRTSIGYNGGGGPGSLNNISKPECGFAYPGDGNYSGAFIHFGGLNTDGNYACQISTSYNTTIPGMRFRTQNSDVVGGPWNSWVEVWHSGNLVPPSVASAASTGVQRDGSGHTYANYGFVNYLNTVDSGSTGINNGAITGIMTKVGDNYLRTGNAATVKTFLGVTGLDVYSVRSNTDSYVGVCREMAWKNYGNSHTIFDASQSTTPTGAGCNNTNPANPWSATYPTLMGYNGSSTYGVRVDVARTAEQLNGMVPTAANNGNTIVSRDGSGYVDLGGGTHGRVISHGIARGSYGSISVVGVTNTYAGIDLTAVNCTWMSDGTTMGMYVNNNAWAWTCSHTGNFTASLNVTAYSDERLKKNWRSLDADFVSRWAGIKSGIYDRTDTELETTQVGASAQDVQAILPDAITIPDEKTGMLALNYGGAALVATVELAKKAVEQAALIEKLLKRIEALENK